MLCIIEKQTATTTSTVTSNRFYIIFHSPIIRKQTHPDNPLLLVFQANCSTWRSFRKWKKTNTQCIAFYEAFNFPSCFFLFRCKWHASNYRRKWKGCANKITFKAHIHTNNAMPNWSELNMCMRANYLICTSMNCMSKLILSFCRFGMWLSTLIYKMNSFFFSSHKQKQTSTKKWSGCEWADAAFCWM